jgi:type I restriction enzyme S subunit
MPEVSEERAHKVRPAEFSFGQKPTEPDQVPPAWTASKLGDLLHEVDVRAGEQGVVESEQVPVLSLTKDFGLIPQSERFDKRIAIADISRYKVLKRGQIVYNPYVVWEGAVYALRNRDAGLVSPVYLVWEASNADAYYLDYLLRTPLLLSTYLRLCSGTVKRRRSLRKTAFREIVVALPPLNEQQRIARVLSTIQQAIEAQDKVIAAARELKRSLMKHLFTYGPVPITETTRVPLKETEIGPVPEHWELLVFGTLIAEGPQNGLYKPQSLYGAGTPIVRINDYENAGGIVTSAANRVRLGHEEVNTFQLNQADILINRVNSLSHLGKAALVGELREATVFESNMMRFAVETRRVLPEYAFRFLCTPAVRDHFRGKSKRAVAQSSINQQDVKSLPFPLPPLGEQGEVATAIATVERKIEAEESRKVALQALFKTIIHHLMTGRIRAARTAVGDG